jgi:hypothetical protein
LAEGLPHLRRVNACQSNLVLLIRLVEEYKSVPVSDGDNTPQKKGPG